MTFSDRDYEIGQLSTRRLSFKEQIDVINERSRKRREQEQTLEPDSTGLSMSDHWPLLADEALHGLAGDIVNSIDPYTEADRVSVLLNILTGFGSCLNAGPHAVVGKDRRTLSTLYALRYGAKAWVNTSTSRQTEGWTAPQREGSSSSLPEQTERTVYGELTDATPSSKALEAFPNWQGLPVKSSVLNMSVWVVRNHIDGLALAKETSHPALILDDVLNMKGRTVEEARAALLPVLITVEQ